MADDEQTPDTPEGNESSEEQTPAIHDEQASSAVEEPTAQTPAIDDEQASSAVEEPTAPSAEDQPQSGGHAVPTEEATEIAGVIEDAPLEALQEHEETAATQTPAETEPSVAEPVAAEPTPAEETVAAGEDDEDEDDEEPTPRVKPAVPGAHLEVDIVPEGVDPLGRESSGDPYALEDDESHVDDGSEQEAEELAEPISTAAIDLAAGARYRATGKRKTAIARVILRPGSGTYLVNGRTLEEHFPRVTLQRNIRQPLETVGYQERMDVVARLHGGGISAQAGALRHGVSRALLEADPNLRGELKRRGFLTRDSRAKERKKAGLKKARKRPQFSKR
jgi:small subunit ribosomal protein S9